MVCHDDRLEDVRGAHSYTLPVSHPANLLKIPPIQFIFIHLVF